MFYLERHVYTQMCRYETCSCACSRTKRRVCAHFLKTCLCITCNIWHHVCHQIFHRRIRNDVHSHELTYEPFSVSNFSHTKSCLRTFVWPTRRTIMRVHCEKTSLYATFWLTWTCPRANVLMGGRVFIKLAHIISYVYARPTCFHAMCRLRDVSCACSRTKKTYFCTLFELERHVHA